MTNEETSLLKRLKSGELDGMVGDDLITSGKSTVWKEIRGGIPRQFKQGPSKKIFDGKENERIDGVLHKEKEWNTNEEKLGFLRKFGFLMKDAAVRKYSAKFKPKN